MEIISASILRSVRNLEASSFEVGFGQYFGITIFLENIYFVRILCTDDFDIFTSRFLDRELYLYKDD